MTLARFMATGTGRGIRVVAGLVLIGVGVDVRGGWGVLLGLVGLVLVAVGVTNVCLLAPVLGAPLKGSACRRSG